MTMAAIAAIIVPFLPLVRSKTGSAGDCGARGDGSRIKETVKLRTLPDFKQSGQRLFVKKIFAYFRIGRGQQRDAGGVFFLQGGVLVDIDDGQVETMFFMPLGQSLDHALA